MMPREPLYVRTYTPGANDAHGNPVDDWGEPHLVNVFAVAPRYASFEPFMTRRSVVVVGLTVLAPYGVAIGPRDRVTVHGIEYEVEGEPGDYTHGPFGYVPGIEIALKRVEG